MILFSLYNNEMNILEVKNLNMSYKTIDGEVEAVPRAAGAGEVAERVGALGEELALRGLARAVDALEHHKGAARRRL